MTLEDQYCCSLNILINCYVIYLDFDFAVNSYMVYVVNHVINYVEYVVYHLQEKK